MSVLGTLGKKLQGALNSLSAVSPIDEVSLDLTLKSICAALLESDVNVFLVKNLREKVKVRVLPQLIEIAKKGQADPLAGNKGKSLIQKTVFEELVALVDPGDSAPPEFVPKKGKTNVIMMVGLQGAGKTTTCTKLATHYTRRGLKTALVCADTFRAGAFDQLKQNAVKAKVPFFGSYTETDPVAIASAGVAKFRAERFEIIIVDTSGRHRQESELFEEMVQIGKAVEPDMTVMVLDGAIGQAAEAQSQAFKEASNFGAIIVTKLDGHAKGGGAISAVAATKTPIIFIGTGEHLHDLEKFSPQPFISKMLGMGDMQGLMEHAQEMALADPERRETMMKKLEKGEFSIRDLKDQMSSVMGMGSISKITSMIPGMGQMMGGAGGEAEAAKKMRRMAFIFDSMSVEELDSDGSLFRNPPVASTSKAVVIDKPKPGANPDGLDTIVPCEPNKRILRVARGSGTSVFEVEEVLQQHLMVGNMAKSMGGKTGMLSKMAQRGGTGARGMPGMSGMPPLGPGGMPDFANMSPAQMAQIQKMMPPGVAEQMNAAGGMAGLAQMMKGMGGGGGGMGALGNMMGIGS